MRLILLLLALALAACGTSDPATTAAAPPARVDPSDVFFSRTPIPLLHIHIYPNNEQLLITNPRGYAACTFTEAPALTTVPSTAPSTAPATMPVAVPTVYGAVQIKLKGSIGSFREYTDRPALTLKMSQKAESFHGLEKFHLNNSVQDEACLNELLGSMIFRQANYPAARVTHARVLVNNRDLGFYVLMEGLDKHFLKRYFPESSGNFYEGLSRRDIDGPLPLASGKGVEDSSDLKGLVESCREPDREKRYARIAQRLDVDLFLTFTALEQMLVHWDGYNLNCNNYRIYFRPSDGRAVFIPHGMDQLFRTAGEPVLKTPPSLVGSAVLSNPAWNAQYRQRVRELLPLFAPEKLKAAIEEAEARMRPVLLSYSQGRAKQFDAKVASLKRSVAGRQTYILAELPVEPATRAATTSAPK